MSWNVLREGPIAVVTYHRPPDNMMPLAMLLELDGIVGELGHDDRVSVIVLASDCPGYFVRHADSQDMLDLTGGTLEQPFSLWTTVLRALETAPQPVVAAVNGQAWGGGCELALASTLRVGGPEAHFSQLEITVGAITGGGATQRLPRTVGFSRAARMIMTGEVIRADEALEIGLVDALLPGADFLSNVLEWLEPISSRARHALIAAKRALYASRDLPIDEGLRLEQELFPQTWESTYGPPGPESLARRLQATADRT